jgi:hypothetical protein
MLLLGATARPVGLEGVAPIALSLDSLGPSAAIVRFRGVQVRPNESRGADLISAGRNLLQLQRAEPSGAEHSQ